MSDAPQTRAEQLTAAAQTKRAEAQRIADGAGAGDRAAGRLAPGPLRQIGRSTDSALRRYTEAIKTAQRLESQAVRERARAEEASRKRFTAEELKGSRFIRTRYGWHEVVRVNAKTVTVKTPYSWTDSIAIDKVTEAR